MKPGNLWIARSDAFEIRAITCNNKMYLLWITLPKRNNKITVIYSAFM